MNSDQVADLLFKGTVEDDDVQAFLDRLLLRIWEVPALMQHLNKVGIVNKEHGNRAIQLVFNLIPQEVIPDVRRIMALNNVKIVKFEGDDDNHTPFVGFEVNLSPSMVRKDHSLQIPY